MAKKTNITTLAYDYRLPKEVQHLSLQTLDFILPAENALIERFWSEGKLKEIKETLTTKQVWKHLEGILDRPAEIPSRIWRGILEVIGRILLTQAERMELFYFLKSITTDESQWCWQLCKDNGKPFVKGNYIYLLKDAVEAYRKKNDRFPDSYFDIARKPELKNGLLTYAPDDGQAIDHLKKTRGKIARRKDTRRWDKYTYLINQHWAKYRELQKELAHLASNVLIDIAEAYDCDSIFVEDLATLKAKRYSRWLNRVINNTVRGQIYTKVEYKGEIKGIKLEKPVKAWHTSQHCPLTGELGKRYTAPNGEPKEGGGWFVSEGCSLDADYVACKNLARRVLFDFKLSCPKSLGYIPRDTLGKQFSRGTEGLRNLHKALRGWNGGIRVVPDSVFYPLKA